MIIQEPCVYFGYIENGPRRVVKVVRQGSEEAVIYQRLQREPLVASDHILPCEIIGLGDEVEPLLIFPFIEDSTCGESKKWPLSRLLQLVHQILEVRFLCA